MICIEGPDNSGKSTLGQYLSEQLGFRVRHSGGPPKTQGEVEGRCARLFAALTPEIVDRFPAISEMVYGPITRPDMSFEGGEQYINLALNRGWLFVYCRPCKGHLLDMSRHVFKPHESEAHITSIKSQWERIVVAYDQLMASVPHIKYDFQTAPPEFLTRLVYTCRRFQ